MIKLHDFDDSIFTSIVHAQAYFDSTAFRLSNMAAAYDFPEGEQSLLLKQLRKINGKGAVNLVEIPMPEECGSRWSDWVLDIKQAKRETLQLLQWRPSHPLNLYGVEVAYDTIFDTPEQALHFERFIVQSWVQTYNSQPLVLFKDTGYSKRRKKGCRPPNRNMAIYADEEARQFFNWPCCHLELRHYGSDNLKRVGITNLQSLIDFDFYAYFQNQLKLYWLTEAGIRKLVKRLMGWGNVKDDRFDVTYHIGGKVIDASPITRIRSRLVADSWEWIGDQRVISAHNLKLAVNQWLNQSTAVKPVRKRATRKKQPKQPRTRISFDKALFSPIDISPMLYFENMLDPTAGRYGDLYAHPNMEFYYPAAA